jgi:hypothetical protein
LAVALVALVGAVAAQTEGFDRETVALLYHKISGEALDFQAVAGMSESVRRASNFDRPGRVVFTPKVTPYQSAAGAFDIKKADVAGLRIGVKGKDLEATVNRLFGPATRRKAGRNAEGYATILVVNELSCMSVPRQPPQHRPGSVGQRDLPAISSETGQSAGPSLLQFRRRHRAIGGAAEPTDPHCAGLQCQLRQYRSFDDERGSSRP